MGRYDAECAGLPGKEVRRWRNATLDLMPRTAIAATPLESGTVTAWAPRLRVAL